jgi:hypothetical protein
MIDIALVLEKKPYSNEPQLKATKWSKVIRDPFYAKIKERMNAVYIIMTNANIIPVKVEKYKTSSAVMTWEVEDRSVVIWVEPYAYTYYTTENKPAYFYDLRELEILVPQFYDFLYHNQ